MLCPGEGERSKDTPFGRVTPCPFFQPNNRNDPLPFQKSTYSHVCPLPNFFENFERQSDPSARKSRGQISLSVSSYLCLFSLLYKPLQPKKILGALLPYKLGCMFFYKDMLSFGFPFCIFTHIGIPPDDRKLTSLCVKFGEL